MCIVILLYCVSCWENSCTMTCKNQENRTPCEQCDMERSLYTLIQLAWPVYSGMCVCMSVQNQKLSVRTEETNAPIQLWFVIFFCFGTFTTHPYVNKTMLTKVKRLNAVKTTGNLYSSKRCWKSRQKIWNRNAQSARYAWQKRWAKKENNV